MTVAFDCDIDPAPEAPCPGCGLGMPPRYLWCIHCIAEETTDGKEISDEAKIDAIVARHHRLLAYTAEALLCS